jgi:hypothetical protein
MHGLGDPVPAGLGSWVGYKDDKLGNWVFSAYTPRDPSVIGQYVGYTTVGPKKYAQPSPAQRKFLQDAVTAYVAGINKKLVLIKPTSDDKKGGGYDLPTSPP